MYKKTFILVLYSIFPIIICSEDPPSFSYEQLSNSNDEHSIEAPVLSEIPINYFSETEISNSNIPATTIIKTLSLATGIITLPTSLLSYYVLDSDPIFTYSLVGLCALSGLFYNLPNILEKSP